MSIALDRRSLLAGTACTAVGAVSARIVLSSGKKGYGLALKSNPEWQKTLQLLKVKWFYTWGLHLPSPAPPGIEFIPMAWGKWSCKKDQLLKSKKAGYKTLLGFNEPDQSKQANMSVEKALELWPMLMDTGMRLGSPAGVQPDGEWMTAFMEGVKRRGYRVDFMTIHSYRGKNAEFFLKKIEELQKLYRKPIWITEFAVADWQARSDKPNKYSPADVLRFMEKALPALEKMEYVERYAWFSASSSSHVLGTSALLDDEGKLTKPGEFYASI